MEQGGSPQQTEHLNPKAWPAPEPTSGLQIAEHPTDRAQWVTQVPNRSRREGQRERHPRRQIAVEMVGSSRGPRALVPHNPELATCCSPKCRSL